jgi:hypothetical protein
MHHGLIRVEQGYVRETLTFLDVSPSLVGFPGFRNGWFIVMSQGRHAWGLYVDGDVTGSQSPSRRLVCRAVF